MSRACAYARDVIVVDDGSTDATAEMAAAAGARVVRRPPENGGSKAHAMEAGLAASDADAILFVDADCLGLTSAHLDAICRPFVEGRAAMSMGMFDYRFWNPLVLRWPAVTGERVIPRWVFEAVPEDKREGFKIEMAINEVVSEARLPAVVRVMRGVTHRTKRDKFGPIEGTRATLHMFGEVLGVMRAVRWRAWWHYARNLKVER